MSALIFDCDGVLADTEQFGHLRAFNELFEQEGLPLHWSVEDYAIKVKIGGGKERLKSILTEEFIAEAGLPHDADELTELVARWHKRKTQIYTDLVGSGVMPGRPGIKRISEEALHAGWDLAVASTSAEPSVRAVLKHAVGPELAEHFQVYAGDVVPAKKPAPDIYLLALKDMNLDPQDVVVVEDSENGMRASVAAGLPTVVTVSTFTRSENFSPASLVVTHLGDSGSGEKAEVLANPHSIEMDGLVTLAHLQEIIQSHRGA
jgi:beta-phosphoglucomutase-like phosphatase (HAD superfamily)